MSRWFRFYDDTINDPKTLKLSDKTFRIWVGILCAASKNDGKIPSFDDLVILLRISASKLQPELEKLIAAELIDHNDDGMKPHNWDRRQFKSDVSTERVKRFRNAERNVSETPPENRVQITDTEKKVSRAVAVATRTTNDDFEKFWEGYPKRQGSNPKQAARKSFEKLVRSGTAPADLVAAARNFAAELRTLGKENTEFVPMASTWLNQQRHLDYLAGPPAANVMSEDEKLKLFAQLRGSNGQNSESSNLRGPGSRAHEIEGDRRQEPAAGPDDQTGYPRVGFVAPVLRRMPGI